MEDFKRQLRNKGFVVKDFNSLTRTAQEAADQIGCGVGQIVKSIIFKDEDDRPVLVAASGSNRIDEKKIGGFLNKKMFKADADYVKKETGFTIGGVPPFWHLQKIVTFIDEDLMNYEEVWAAAGASNSVFRIEPQELIDLSGGIIAKIKAE
ncbi:MAG TPA: YbaK/EbsC family protein [Patescibacteria group bacterium]